MPFDKLQKIVINYRWKDYSQKLILKIVYILNGSLVRAATFGFVDILNIIVSLIYTQWFDILIQ